MAKSRVLFEADVGKLLDAPGSIDSKIQSFSRLLSEFLDEAVVSVFLFRPDDEELILKGTSLRVGEPVREFRFSAAGTIPHLSVDEDRVVTMREVDRPEESARQAEHVIFPLQAGGEVVGVLSVERAAPECFGSLQRDVTRRMVQRLAAAVGDAKREDETSRKMTKISAINEAGVTLVSNKELPEVLQVATAISSLVMGAESCLVRIYDEERGSYVLGDGYGVGDRQLRSLLLRLDQAAVREILKTGTPLLVRDTAHDGRYAGHVEAARSFICHPLRKGPDIIGTISLFNKNVGNTFSPPYFNAEDLDNFTRLVKYVEQAVSAALESRKRRELTERDEVTGLPDVGYFRTRLIAEISRARRFASKVVLITCETSLRQGEEEGLHARARFRKMSRSVAAAITAALRDYDVVACLAEGKFGMILPQAEDGTISAIPRVRQAVEAEVERHRASLPADRLDLRFSQAVFPEDGESCEALLTVLQRPGSPARQ